MVRIPKYRLHKSSGRAVVTISGRDYYLGEFNTPASKRKYALLIAEYNATDGKASFGVAPNVVTMAMVMADYLKFADRHYSKGSNNEPSQIRMIFKVVKKLYASLPASKFGPLQFKAVRQTLLDDPRCQRGPKSKKVTSKPLSRGYINAQMSRLVRMFRWAASEGIVPGETFLNIKIIPGLQRGRSTAPESPRIEPVSDAVVNATLPHCSPIVADMIRIQRLTGMRPGELCKLTPGMLDRSGDVWVATLKEHKGSWRGKERHVYFGPKAQELLKPYLLRSAESNCFSPAESEAKRRAIISEQRKTPANQGNRPGYSNRTRQGRKPRREPGLSYDTCSYNSAIRSACRLAKIEHWSPNRLRHTAGTQIRAEFGLDHAAAVLGHSEVAVTQVYAEMDYEKAVEVARKIG